MLILVEGPDNTGKTTLARALEERGFHYAHNGAPPEEHKDLYAVYSHQIGMAVNGRFKDIVIDRLHLSEYVYGNAVRDGSRLTLRQIDLLTGQLVDAGGRVVLCSAPWERTKALWESRLDREYVKDIGAMYRVYMAYENLARLMLGSPWLSLYDWTEYEGRVMEFARRVSR